MKQCGKCGYHYPDTIDKCGVCKGELTQISVDNPNSIGWVTARIAFAIFMIVGIISFAISAENSQYESDYNSMQNKTYDEMSTSEQKVFQDEVEWELENADE